MAEQTVNKICISCPIGCHLVITKSLDEDSKLSVTGNRCPKGLKYAESEMTNPTRMVTTTVEILEGEILRLPVRTAKPISKHMIFEVCEALRKVKVNAPVEIGDVIIHNIRSSGVDIIACRSVK
ncbi:DUF1667 domain-containing protein [Fusibacter bizertensis]